MSASVKMASSKRNAKMESESEEEEDEEDWDESLPKPRPGEVGVTKRTLQNRESMHANSLHARS
jgi:hypothetical protein